MDFPFSCHFTRVYRFEGAPNGAIPTHDQVPQCCCVAGCGEHADFSLCGSLYLPWWFPGDVEYCIVTVTKKQFDGIYHLWFIVVANTKLQMVLKRHLVSTACMGSFSFGLISCPGHPTEPCTLTSIYHVTLTCQFISSILSSLMVLSMNYKNPGEEWWFTHGHFSVG